MTRVQVCFIKPVRCCYTCGRRQLRFPLIITGFKIFIIFGLTVVSHIAKGDYYVVSVVSCMHRGATILCSNIRANMGKGDVVAKAVSALPHKTTESSTTS